MSMPTSVCAHHQSAVAWAQQLFPASAVDLVSESAWAATYRLSTPAANSYLKILPGAAHDNVARLVAIATHFRQHVPDILGFDQQQGWLLSADHQGTSLSAGGTDGDWNDALARFAAIQCDAARAPDLLNMLDAVQPLAELEALLQFLQAPSERDSAPGAAVGAAYFIGDADASRYARLLRKRSALLHSHLAAAARLPRTISHGDLHSHNVATRPDGRIVFFDWDEAAVGPAGLCLHGMFGGCALPSVLVQRIKQDGTAGDSAAGLRLQAYIDALVEGGYVLQDVLLDGLIGSMCAGQMRFVSSFGRYPGDLQRSDAAGTIRSRLSDTLDLCDWLASRTRETCAATADDYENCGEWRRAHRLVQDQLAREPERPDLLARFATLAWQLGDLKTCDEAAREAHGLAPHSTLARLALARASLGGLQLDAAQSLLAEVLKTEPGHAHALALADRVHRAAVAMEQAAAPHALPRVAVSDAEQQAGQLEPDTLALLVHLFKKHGAAQVDNVFSPDTMAHLQGAFTASYGQHFHDGPHADALQVGNKRYMLTMELDDTFGSSDLVASSLMLPVMQSIVGVECILSAYTAVISLPGSDAQTVHKDHSELFEEEGWHLVHPSFAAQIIVPLLALDEVTGTTRIFKDTQRVPLNRSMNGPAVDPVVPLGSCVLLDYSVAHYGMGNRSDRVRPILNLVYSRPWFRDCRNYHLQPPLRFAQAFLEQAPPAVRKLVGWWDLERRAAAAP